MVNKLFEMYKKEKFDLILMDINMPIMDGIRATKEILILLKILFMIYQ